jgi:type I restriction enzyme S subunit
MAKALLPPSVQAGIPKLGSLPRGWRTYAFSELLKEVSRPIDLKSELEYQLVVARRSRGGIEPREKLTGEKILTKTQFEIKQGDFLISNRQIVHGACGIVPKSLDGSIVSNEYTVLHSKGLIDLNFLEYLSHTQYFQQTCFHSSVGVDVEKMIFRIQEWFKYKVHIPSLDEQRKIVEILRAWDTRINQFSSLNTCLKKSLNSAIEKCTSRKLPLIPLADFFAPFSRRAKDIPLPLELISVTQDRGLVFRKDEVKRVMSPAGVTSNYKEVTPGDFVISLRSFQGGLEASDKRGLVSPAYTVLRPKMEHSYDFYRHFFKSQFFLELLKPAIIGIRDGKQIEMESFYQIEVPFPSLKIQESIAQLLCSVESAISISDQLRVALITQKQGLMQELLNGKTRVRTDL